MLKYNFITEDEYVIGSYLDNAWDGNLSNTDNQRYYLDYVTEKAKEQSAIFPFDLKIQTSFNQKVFKAADQVISKYYNQEEALKNTQPSLIAMQLDGAILTMIGGSNYKKSQYNRALYAKRQPGSSFKLFTYLEALHLGYDNDEKVN